MKNILVTGGTGSFGKAFIKIVLERFAPEKVIIFSRDELKQHEMRISGFNQRCLRYFIGDVRDRNRLYRAFDGVDTVVHAAAMKQVPTAEYNPFEAIKTNVIGAANVIDAALDHNVRRVIALSSDKAVNPINLYGATKLCADKLFIAANNYTGERPIKFSVVRYGNVAGSRGSVIPLFLKKCTEGTLPITNLHMTRFWITLEQAVELALYGLEHMNGGEIFVPKIPSVKIKDIAMAIAPECELKVVGIRPGEKLHEVLIPTDEARYTRRVGRYYVIYPTWAKQLKGEECPYRFCYSSDNNDEWLMVEDIREAIYGRTR